MNTFIQAGIAGVFIVIIWNMMRYFLESIYINRLTNDYIVFTTGHGLNIILFIFSFLLFLILKQVGFIEFIREHF